MAFAQSRRRRIFGCCTHNYQVIPFLFIALLQLTAGVLSLPFKSTALRDEAAERSTQTTHVRGSRHLRQTESTAGGGRTGPLVIAEGGAQYLYPEMTMRAYEEAIDNGADYVVCMLATTSDGKAFCHPSLELSGWTDIKQYPDLAARQFRFAQQPGLYSWNFTLEEIQKLKVVQTKPELRTKAYDGLFRVATPEEIIDTIARRAATHPSAKRVGLAIEINKGSVGMANVGINPTPLSYAIQMLWTSWSTPAVPAMVISSLQSDFSAFVGEDGQIERLLRLDASFQVSPSGAEDSLSAMAVNATGVMLHVDSILTPTQEPFWGQPLPKVAWSKETLMVVRDAALAAYVWGFTEGLWNTAGPMFNTFLADPLAMYRTLFYGPLLGSLVAGVATDWPATAAIAAACYKNPVPLYTATGAPTNRPLVIASGGSVGLLPGHTNLSYQQAVNEGADFIECILQISQDGVLFCMESQLMSKSTDVDQRSEWKSRARFHNPIGLPEAVLDWWTFDFPWSDIRTLRVTTKTRNNVKIQQSPRSSIFYGKLPPPTFEEFIGIAINASRIVGIYIKIDNPSYQIGMGTEKPEVPRDQITLLLATLHRWGFVDANNTYTPIRSPLLIASTDGCGLARMHELSNGTLQLLKRTGGLDTCEAIMDAAAQNASSWWLSEQGLEVIKGYARGISPLKKSLLTVNNGSTVGAALSGFIDPEGINPGLVEAQSLGLVVSPRSFRTDVYVGDGDGAFDYLADTTFELQYYVDQLNVDAFESQFIATAMGFLESSCRPWPGLNTTDPGFNVTQVNPGALAREIIQIWNLTTTAGNPGNNTHRHTAWEITMRGRIVIAAAALGTAAVFVLLVVLVHRKMRGNFTERSFKESIRKMADVSNMKHFSLTELMNATDTFSKANRLGSGGSGTVYRGILGDGTRVAVKKLHIELKGSLGDDYSVYQLLNEVEIIGTVHNRNVVPLRGICTDKELLLVYDYMPNGSVQDALFDHRYPIQLKWPQWYNIVVGTAKGLAYLHEECEHKIIHRDIKPANILLDVQLNPRVADFGLARNMELDKTHVTTQVMGSIGYLAPDYVTTGQLTEKSDTYSYGMLLITIITRRQPVAWESYNLHEQVTLEWVKRKAQEGVRELLTVIHPTFEGYNEREAVRWLYTALLCSQNDPLLRPSMGDVVQMLMGKREVPEICLAPAMVIFPDFEYSQAWRGEQYSRPGASTSWSRSLQSKSYGRPSEFDDSQTASKVCEG